MEKGRRREVLRTFEVFVRPDPFTGCRRLDFNSTPLTEPLPGSGTCWELRRLTDPEHWPAGVVGRSNWLAYAAPTHQQAMTQGEGVLRSSTAPSFPEAWNDCAWRRGFRRASCWLSSMTLDGLLWGWFCIRRILPQDFSRTLPGSKQQLRRGGSNLGRPQPSASGRRPRPRAEATASASSRGLRAGADGTTLPSVQRTGVKGQ